MATYKAEPNTEVSGVGTDGEVLTIVFGKDGTAEVPDDFQEAHVMLSTARDVERVKGKK